MHKRLDNAVAMVEDAFRQTTLAEILAEPTKSRPLAGSPPPCTAGSRERRLGHLPSCATANPTEVVLTETEQGKGILSVVDGFSQEGVEDEGEIKWRKDFLRQIGYKQLCD